MRAFVAYLALLLLPACEGVREAPVPARGAFAWSPVGLTYRTGAVELFVVSRDGGLLRSRCAARPCETKDFGNLERGPGAPPPGLASEPAVVATDDRRVDIFAKGADGAIWHQTWLNTLWLGWETLGGSFVGGPAAMSWGPGRLDVFAIDAAGILQHMFCVGSGTPMCRGSAWSVWESTAGRPAVGITGTPSGVGYAGDRIDVLARGVDGSIQHQGWDKGWIGWHRTKGEFASDPVVAMRGSHLEAFALDRSGALLHSTVSNKRFRSFKKTDVALAGKPAVIVPSSRTIDLYAPDAAGATLVHVRCDGKGDCSAQ